MGMDEQVKYVVEDLVAVVTINHPPVNALNQQTLQDLDHVLGAIATDAAVKVVIITGN